MSTFFKTLVQFTDGVTQSQPFVAYVESQPAGPIVVRVAEDTSMNEETGELRVSMKVSGLGIVVSHDPEWFASNLSGWTDQLGKGVVIPFAEEDPATVLARVRAARTAK